MISDEKRDSSQWQLASSGTLGPGSYNAGLTNAGAKSQVGLVYVSLIKNCLLFLSFQPNSNHLISLFNMANIFDSLDIGNGKKSWPISSRTHTSLKRLPLVPLVPSEMFSRLLLNYPEPAWTMESSLAQDPTSS